jgi:hypothetical protein
MSLPPPPPLCLRGLLQDELHISYFAFHDAEDSIRILSSTAVRTSNICYLFILYLYVSCFQTGHQCDGYNAATFVVSDDSAQDLRCSEDTSR